MRRAVDWLLDELPARFPRLCLVGYLFAAVIAGGKAVNYLATRDGAWWLPLGLYDVAFAALMVHGAVSQVRLLRRRKIDDEGDEAGGFGDGVGEVGRVEG